MLKWTDFQKRSKLLLFLSGGTLSFLNSLAEELDTLEAHEPRFRAGDDPFGLGRHILRGMGLRDERILFSGNPIVGRGRIGSVTSTSMLICI